jgi:hypothetical protein
MRNMEINTHIEKDTMLNFPVWQENWTLEGFLMHVTAVLDAIKKRGHFEDYDKAAFKYNEASKAIASARDGLSLLEESEKKANKVKKKLKEKTKEGENVTPKAPAKAPEPKAPAKAPEPKAAAQEAKVAPVADDQMKASFLSDLEKAKQAQRAATCLHSIQTCFLLRASTLGTRSSASRWKGTPTSTFKVTRCKAQGECRVSRFTIA